MDAQKQSIRFQTLHHVWDQRFKNPNDLCQCKVVTQRMNCVLRRNQTFASPIKIKLGHDLFSLFFFLSVSWFSTLTIKVWDLIFFFFGREQIKPEEDQMVFFSTTRSGFYRNHCVTSACFPYGNVKPAILPVDGRKKMNILDEWNSVKELWVVTKCKNVHWQEAIHDKMFILKYFITYLQQKLS